MANFKGSGILVIRKLLENLGGDAEARFLASLSPELAKTYKTCLSASWVPIEASVALSAKAADLLYTEASSEQRLFRLGRDRAALQIKGIYKIFFPIFSISAILGNAANLWSTQHDRGRALVEKSDQPNQGTFCVTGYPEMLPPLLHLVKGFVAGVLEAAGAKNPQIDIDKSNPDLWKWRASWS
jgi:hypothetical protein